MKKMWFHILIVLTCAVAFDAAWSALASHAFISHASPSRAQSSLKNNSTGSDTPKPPRSSGYTTAQLELQKDDYGNPPCLGTLTDKNGNKVSNKDNGLPCYQITGFLQDYCQSLLSASFPTANVDSSGPSGIGGFDPDTAVCTGSDSSATPSRYAITFDETEPDFTDACKFGTANATTKASTATRMDASPANQENFTSGTPGAEVVCS